MKIVFFIIALIVIQGCASLSKEHCEKVNWDVAGEGASLSGTEYEKGKELMRSCSNMGIEVDEREYRRGYEEGINKYCQEDMASWHGLSGKEYSPRICENNKINLENAYFKGLSVYLIKRSEENEINVQIIERVISDIKKGIEIEVTSVHSKKKLEENIKELNDLVYKLKYDDVKKLNSLVRE